MIQLCVLHSSNNGIARGPLPSPDCEPCFNALIPPRRPPWPPPTPLQTKAGDRAGIVRLGLTLAGGAGKVGGEGVVGWLS